MKSIFFVKTRNNLGQYREIYCLADSIYHLKIEPYDFIDDEIVEIKKLSIDKPIDD